MILFVDLPIELSREIELFRHGQEQWEAARNNKISKNMKLKKLMLRQVWWEDLVHFQIEEHYFFVHIIRANLLCDGLVDERNLFYDKK